MRIPKMVTLEVSEDQAEELLVAGQLGQIHLTLRGRGPTAGAGPVTDPLSPTWASDVSPALEILDKTAPPADKGHDAIEVFHGPKIERRCPTPTGLVACP
jgi:hypothetical protein